MTATQALTEDLKKQVFALEADIRRRVDEDQAVLGEWQRTHRQATEQDRTAWSWMQWRDDRVNQTAVAWVLMSVFIRFCEDNALVKPVWITGPGRRRQEALDAELAFFREHGTWTEREWLEDAIAYLGKLPATKALVDSHSALRYASPSGEAVEDLFKFWRNRSDDGRLIHDLQDETLSTRFLGDLYQDLSQYAKDTYALLQTPVFVEEHILDRTLEPALREHPLEGFRMIDPTCGSGHFLLGAFDRLLDRWHKQAPAMEIQARVQSALDAIHGVDLNPFAVAIARFRLTVAALQACDLRSLEDAPAFKYHLAVGDSLIHGPDADVLPGMEERGAFMPFHYATEDGPLLLELLEEGRYDAVVGNPPYITVKDPALNKIYRSKFGKVCKGMYALTVPFMVQFFTLAKRGEQSGWVGMITSNSFMKREFGAPLIEKFLARRDILLIEDTSVAHIPHHGTPTIIVIARNQAAVSQSVRAALGIRREIPNPVVPAEGRVWASIVNHIDDPGWSDEWITVSDLDRKLLSTHPWSLRGGGAVQLKESLENAAVRRLADRVSEIGFGAVTREDSAYMVGDGILRRQGIEASYRRPIVVGDNARDWSIDDPIVSLWPYDPDSLSAASSDSTLKLLWPYKRVLSERVAYGDTQLERGLQWFEYSMFFTKRFRIPLSIAFAFVATHNHFVLDRGQKVFNRSAPVIKLPPGTSEDEHLALLAILNSSTACFWLKQSSYDKGAGGIAEGIKAESWERFYEFTGTTLQDYPLPSAFPLEIAALLDSLAQGLGAREPSAVCASGVPSREILASAQRDLEGVRARMIAVQEELDWEVYRLYSLIDEDLTYGADDMPGLALGERAFEIALARSGEETAWFVRHGSQPIVEIPAHWPAEYRELVQRRLELIAGHPYIGLLEKPEYKRRWSTEAWDKRQERALRDWLLDRLEERRFWFDSAGGAEPKSIGQLADEVARDADMVSVLALWEGRPDVPVAESLQELLVDEAVPFLTAYRYKDSGLRKWEAWEETWGLQRREDRGEKVGTIQVPPKYTSADFRRPSYWRARGKLDVPKERFILYPDANRQGDPTALLGWAGWDHAEQSLALSRIIGEREREGWDDERLVPLVAGLAELQPWVEQWHSGVDKRYGVSLAAFCQEQLDQRAAQVGKTLVELGAWRPAPSGRGRKPRAKGGAE
jgi:uncharacterized protein DUF7008/Eco57I restriction-modification methylase